MSLNTSPGETKIFELSENWVGIDPSPSTPVYTSPMIMSPERNVEIAM